MTEIQAGELIVAFELIGRALAVLALVAAGGLLIKTAKFIWKD